MTVLEVVVSSGAVRLPAAGRVELVPFGARPGAPDWCRPLVDELLITGGADVLGLMTWLDDDEKAWRLLLPSLCLKKAKVKQVNSSLLPTKRQSRATTYVIMHACICVRKLTVREELVTRADPVESALLPSLQREQTNCHLFKSDEATVEKGWLGSGKRQSHIGLLFHLFRLSGNSNTHWLSIIIKANLLSFHVYINFILWL